MQTYNKPIIAISSCLLGNPVRYDGQDKRHSFVLDTLSDLCEWTGICPEVDAGLGVPRPPVELVQMLDTVRVVGRDNKKLDVTADLRSAALRLETQIVSQKSPAAVCGFIWQSRSPSCGLGSTPLRNAGGDIIAHRSGLVAAYIASQFPWLPMREDTALMSIASCMDFFAEVEWVQRWRQSPDREALWSDEKVFLKWPAAAKRDLETLLDSPQEVFLTRFLHYWRLHYSAPQPFVWKPDYSSK